jgi:hypothetical protein
MNSTTSVDGRREQAIALRRAGKSRREIKAILGIAGNSTLDDLLAGVPPPEWTRRPNAKDDLRVKARELAAERPVREAQREATRAAAAAEIGTLTQRELLIAGAIAYWCAGAKNKPYHRHDRVTFMNSDPALITLFLRFLDAAGVDRNMIVYRVYIHETADVTGAERFWLEVTGADPTLFRRPALKRHQPQTVRKNVGADYRGCLRVDVRQNMELYRRIEGWTRAVTNGADGALGR